MKLENKVVFVTGGGDGMGRATALQAAREGAAVAVFELSSEKLESVTAEIEKLGGTAIGFLGDITNEEEVSGAIKSAATQLGSIHAVVNNVGFDHAELIHEMSTELWNRVIGINLSSIYYTTKYAVPYMLKQGDGSIVNISSVAGINAVAGTPAYSTAKAGVIMLSKAMAKGYGESNIRVNCICPGLTRTSMILGMPDDYIASVESRIPMERLGEPDDIADAVIFLLSRDAAYINGAVLSVDGGLA